MGVGVRTLPAWPQMVRLSGVEETVKKSGWQGRNASGLEIESWKGS